MCKRIRGKCNIGSKTFFAERDNLQAAPKIDLPSGHFHLPFHSVKQVICPKHYLPRGPSLKRSCSACPIAVFCRSLLRRGKWLCCTLRADRAVQVLDSRLSITNLPLHILCRVLANDFENGCPKLPILQFFGVQNFKGNHNTLTFQPSQG